MLTDEKRQELIQAAQAVRRWAYVPYSDYPVGAALLTSSGRLYDGVNIENAAYPTGICAERVAVFKAVSEGERQFIAIAVVTSNGGTPCGSCRQVLAEFGLDTSVLIADEQGNLIQERTVAELLPGSFGPDQLAGAGASLE
jgi:cytidine deaminase